MSRRDRGTALPLAVLGLVIIAGLVAAGLAGALVEQRVGRNGLYAVQAAGAAASGVAQVVAGWEGYGPGGLAPGESLSLPRVTVPGRSEYAPVVTRLNGELFRIRVAATRTDADGGVLAGREENLIVRLGDSGAAAPVQPIAGRPWLMAP